MSACGQLSWKNGRLHNAAVQCMRLLSRLIDPKENPHYDAFLIEFLSCDFVTFQGMRGATHFQDDRAGRPTARRLVGLIKRHNPDVIKVGRERVLFVMCLA